MNTPILSQGTECTFENYTEQWFHDFLEDHEDIEDFYMEIFNAMDYNTEEYLDDDETCLDFLLNLSGQEIYKKLICGNTSWIDDVPSRYDFLKGMFMEASRNIDYDFVDEFIEDMAEHAEDYNDLPDGFFKDLAYGGCVSGMVGMLIYNNDCKQIYINHIDSMEQFIEDFEEEMGEPIRNEKHLLHYTFVCWLCYEELAYRIGRTLFPDTF